MEHGFIVIVSKMFVKLAIHRNLSYLQANHPTIHWIFFFFYLTITSSSHYIVYCKSIVVIPISLIIASQQSMMQIWGEGVQPFAYAKVELSFCDPYPPSGTQRTIILFQWVRTLSMISLSSPCWVEVIGSLTSHKKIHCAPNSNKKSNTRGHSAIESHYWDPMLL